MQESACRVSGNASLEAAQKANGTQHSTAFMLETSRLYSGQISRGLRGLHGLGNASPHYAYPSLDSPSLSGYFAGTVNAVCRDIQKGVSAMRIRRNSIVTLAIILGLFVVVQVIFAVQPPAGQQRGP